MPRRPRPASRRPPTDGAGLTNVPINTRPTRSKSEASPKRSWTQRDDTGSESDDNSNGDSSHSDTSTVHLSPKGDRGVDAPRVAQWIDEDDLDNLSSADERDNELVGDEGVSKGDCEHDNLDLLQDDLASLPLGVLRTAQRALARTHADSESENDTDLEPDPDNTPDVEVRMAKKPEWSSKPGTDISKRKNKHAPTEVTSKKPVTRRRHIIDVPKLEPRDPRFLPFVGQFKPEAFRKQYDFLSDMHVTEMKTLKEHLKRARKLLVSSPRHLRDEREQEVTKLELAVKRAESSVNKDKKDRVEQQALNNIKKDERVKQKAGKGAWFMKDSDKKRLLVRARYDALAADGGKDAVKKAIKKKQIKVGQKEKRRRPFSSEVGQSRKRNYDGNQGEGSGSSKRRKLG